jgi:glycosyltransferase involved in cell wall biosynthesis
MKVGMVSVYPPPASKHAESGGVASYTKNLVISLLDSCKIVVFANRMSNTDNEYQEGAMVYRCWNKGIMYPFQIFRKLMGKNLDAVHVQHEYFLFGNASSIVLFPFMLCLLKLLRKPVVVTLHGVIPLGHVNKQFLRDNLIDGYAFVLRWGILILTRLIVSLADVVAVHEDSFKRVLVNEYNVNKEKVYVIYHGIEEPLRIIESDLAKEALRVSRKKVLLFFGYLAGYKGIEVLVEAFRFLKHKEDFVLFVAGGEPPRLKCDSDYSAFLRLLKKKAMNVSRDIIFTGFVPEDMIEVYFSAADLVIFPYKIVMSSSGPMSLAISYEKPFLVSNVFPNPTRFEDLSFRLFAEDLATAIENYFENHAFREDVSGCLRELKNARSWHTIAGETFRVYELVSE